MNNLRELNRAYEITFAAYQTEYRKPCYSIPIDKIMTRNVYLSGLKSELKYLHDEILSHHTMEEWIIISS